VNGSYVLIVNVKKNLKNFQVGKLGKLNFKKGFYCYVGSAIGKAAIENRIKRHFRKRKRVKWHIDYLLASKFVSLKCAIIFPSKKKIECSISEKIRKFAEGSIKNFGSSDCKCKSHLYYFGDVEKLISAINSI
jgi:Uri superfamily endonuclease